jgi:hypothetical protein
MGEGIAVKAQEQISRRGRSPSKQERARFPQVFRLQLADMVAFIGLGILVAYISVVLAFLLLRLIY